MTRRFVHIPFSPARCPVFYGWPIVAAGSLGVLMSVPGQTIGVSVFTDSLLSALGLTRSQLSIAYMFGTIGSACLLPRAGRLYDRLGSRATAAIASVSLAVVLLILGQSDVLADKVAGLLGLAAPVASFVVVWAAFFALRFWGQGVLALASYSMVAKWFDRKRGLVSGLTGICVTLGFSSAPLVFELLIRQLGWRGAWMALAALLAFVFTPVALVIFRDNPEECGLRPDGATIDGGSAENAATIAEPCWTRGQAVRTGAFWVFSLSLALFGMYVTGLAFHVVSIFETAGMTRAQAISIFLPASVVAVLVHLSAGWLSDRMSLIYPLIVMLAAMVLSSTGLALLGPGLPLVMLIVGKGMASGLFGLLTAVTWARFFGRRHLGAIGGLNLSVSVLFSALGPVLFSQSLAWSGSYLPAPLVCLAAAVVLLIAAMKTRPPVAMGMPGPVFVEFVEPTTATGTISGDAT